MRDPHLFPKLRWPIDARIDQIQGRRVLILRCPLGISEEPLILVAEVAPIVSSFDGKSSVDDIVKRFSDYGVGNALVLELVKRIDQALFLDSPSYYAAERSVRQRFEESPTRSPALAGLSYPGDRGALEQEVDGYLEKNGVAPVISPGKMLGIMSPHIDYRRGGLCYGITYQNLQTHDHDLYLLIGTAHQYSPRIFHLTKKDFLTPLGMLSCDRELVDAVARGYGEERSFADELLHRQEHSLELQTPFLRRLKAQGKILPVLVGGFHRMVGQERVPNEYAEYEDFIGSLVECLKPRIASGIKLCFVAGVDMAHVGQHFGDEQRLTPSCMETVAHRDREYLDALVAQDKKKLFAHIASDGDARRICGFPTMYTVMDLCDRLSVRYHAVIYDYRQAIDYESDCAVTFAGAGFYL